MAEYVSFLYEHRKNKRDVLPAKPVQNNQCEFDNGTQRDNNFDCLEYDNANTLEDCADL